ncbi:MAG: uroporphyrinogen decarboxylase, partial [Gammaproteobacteria bacterium]
LDLCTNPELACEVTLQPLDRFDLDAAILFSDILTIPDAMGLGLYFVEGEGPRFEKPVRDARSIKALAAPDPTEDLAYVLEAVRLIRRELAGRVPLIGFAGSPWTLATYMVEGGPTKNFSQIKGLMYTDPNALETLLATLSRAVTDYLNAQVAAGAQALMVFDTWGGVLSPEMYRRFSLAPMGEIVAGLTREHDGQRIPVILFTKGGGAWLENMAATGCDALGLDWTTPLDEARQRVGDRVALQGNLDPAVLYAPPERIRDAVADTLAAFGEGSGHVFNLGHGIHPDVDPDHVSALVAAVRELSPAFHGS